MLQVNTYIDALPQKMDLPFMWDESELQLIRNEGLRAEVQASKDRCSKQYAVLKASSPNCPFTEPEFQWALACVLSRSFQGPSPALLLKVGVHVA
jgi:hypothetical protein